MSRSCANIGAERSVPDRHRFFLWTRAKQWRNLSKKFSGKEPGVISKPDNRFFGAKIHKKSALFVQFLSVFFSKSSHIHNSFGDVVVVFDGILVVTVVLQKEDSGRRMDCVGFEETLDHGNVVLAKVAEETPHLVRKRDSGRRTTLGDLACLTGFQELSAVKTESEGDRRDSRAHVFGSAVLEVSVKSFLALFVGMEIRSWGS